jgi:hypothetical protein
MAGMLKQVLMIAIAAIAASPGYADNLIKNGSFEKPVVPDGGDQEFSTGSKFNSWTVVGQASNVAVVSGDQVSGGYSFLAKKGAQWLDLTGAFGNSATGVQQTIKTQPGATYSLSFYLGNIFNPGGELGVDSTVTVYVDGASAGTFTNSKDGGDKLVWQKFSTEFVAQNAKTKVAFISGDPSTDNSNGLDGVTVSLAK